MHVRGKGRGGGREGYGRDIGEDWAGRRELREIRKEEKILK